MGSDVTPTDAFQHTNQRICGLGWFYYYQHLAYGVGGRWTGGGPSTLIKGGPYVGQCSATCDKNMYVKCIIYRSEIAISSIIRFHLHSDLIIDLDVIRFKDQIIQI